MRKNTMTDLVRKRRSMTKEVLNLRLVREPSRNGATLGKLYLNGLYFAETLEDQDRALEGTDGKLKVKGETAIPCGDYKVILNDSARFKERMPLVLDVPFFEGIRIHPGNTIEDTSGCILVGTLRHNNTLLNSRVAYNALLDRIHRVLLWGGSCELKIVREGQENVTNGATPPRKEAKDAGK